MIDSKGEAQMRLKLWTILGTVATVTTVINLLLSQGGNPYSCPGARPCMFCSYLPPHRDPCFGGCPRGGQCQLNLPVDGYCPDELYVAAAKGYNTCQVAAYYREFLCCRPDQGCTLNPAQPNGQWGPCLRIPLECFNPLTGESCPFIVWGEGRFCSEEDGRPCCDPNRPCTP